MKKTCLFLFVVFLITSAGLAQNSYFFDDQTSFDSSIKSPSEFLGYEIGSLHTRHDAIVSYLNYLSMVSDKARLDTIGKTYENRQLVVLKISSQANIINLEDIRKKHLDLINPNKSDLSIEDQKSIVYLGYNVHGNEPSSSEAALLTAYYYIAGDNEEIRKALEESVIMIDPTFNPDGRDRHTTWANSFKGSPLVSDPMDAEHNEMWPRGRTNHYWFDLNRDWLPLAHVESQARIAYYHKWYPNVVTDFHEMGTNATYFFEPTKPYGSENPVVPRSNYDVLNVRFAAYFHEALDEIGSLYFTKEQFDNSYPGYGSTYPDMHGALGLVFEQASSRGHLQDSRMGPVSFAFTIRNHFTSSKATVKAAVEERELLANHLHDYFSSAVEEGKKAKGGWAFGDPVDESLNKAFLELLNQHKIEVEAIKDGPYPYYASNSQKQYRMVRTLFERVTKFHDSVFYDTSSWTAALSYNIPHKRLLKEPKTSVLDEPDEERLLSKSTYAYILPWNQYNSASILQKLLTEGLYVNTAFKPFSTETDKGLKEFSYGTLMVPVSRQNKSVDEVFEIMSKLKFPVYAVDSGFSKSGIDLGSNNFKTVRAPKALMLIGGNVSSYEAGEVWFQGDDKLGMPITKVMIEQASRLDWSKYNTMVLVSGNYDALDKKTVERIKLWVQEGGTLISQRSATSWLINSGFVKAELIKREADNDQTRMDYVKARDHKGSFVIGGSIYMADVDITHPLGFGYSRRDLPVYRNHSIFLKPCQDQFSTVVKYDQSPLLGGYVNSKNLDYIAGSASLISRRMGRGSIILFADNPNFRGMWFGTNRLFFNALYFGDLI